MLVIARKANTSVLCYDETAGEYTIEVFDVAGRWGFVIESSASIVRWSPHDLSESFNLYPASSEYSGDLFLRHTTSNQVKLSFDVSPSTIVLRRELLTPEAFVTFRSGGGLERIR